MINEIILAHIFLDDAFENSKLNNQFVVNSYVKQLIKIVNQVFKKTKNPETTNIEILETPYGGQLIWTLPGSNKLFVHLKNKKLIRHKKRWSQVRNILVFRYCNYQLVLN